MIRAAVSALCVCTLVSSVACGPPRSAGDPSPFTRPIGTMSDLMVTVIYPASDAIFYIETRVPTDSDGWTELEGKALMLAESANLLMMPGRARDREQWMEDAKLMLDAGTAAFLAAKARDVEALVALNDRLYQSCVSCHRSYRPGYGRRGGPPRG